MLIVTILAFILILSILVLIHELGHFLTAKKFGIKVEEFGLGFPPRVYGKKIGETVYSINALPIGGFVKLYGEDNAGGGSLKREGQAQIADIKRAFFARPLWQRMIVVTAGVIMNFVLAVVCISVLFGTVGVALPSEEVLVREINNGSPAQIADLRVGDRVVELNNININSSQAFIDATQKSKGKPSTIVVERNGQLLEKVLTPRAVVPEGQGPIGVAISDIEIRKYAWWEAPIYGTIEAAKFSVMIVAGIVGMITDLVMKGVAPQGVAGPVGVAELTGEAVQSGWVAILWFVSLLSLNLAVLNILPIPALDGGRFFFMIIELVTRKKVSPKYEALAHGIGLALLLGLMLVVTVFDVARLARGESILP